MSPEQECSQTPSQRLPDTCPISQAGLSQLTWNSQARQEPWGRLYPTTPEFQYLELVKDEYTVGRGPTCDLTPNFRMNNSGSGASALFGAISKVHFKIRRTNISSLDYDDFVVRLDDLSSNGTFVNGKKIGRGNSVILENNNEIAVCFSYYKAFIYISSSLDSEVKTYPQDVKMKYAISRVLGSGSFGQVRLVFDKTLGTALAMKVIQKKRLGNTARQRYDPIRTQREVDILKALSHPFVIRFENVIDSHSHMFILTEYMEGGELFDKVRRGPLPETEAKLYFLQLAMAVRYLHNNGIIHRILTSAYLQKEGRCSLLVMAGKTFFHTQVLDSSHLSGERVSVGSTDFVGDIKLENILLSTRGPETIIKLSDFGFSKFLDEESVMMTYCGTPMYIAPEILKNKGRPGSYDKKVDVWSMGVVLFICLSGVPPFDSSAGVPLTDQIMRCSYTFSQRQWSRVTRKAVYLVRRMLATPPRERLSTQEVLDHAWLQDKSVSMRVNRIMRILAGGEYTCSQSNDEVESDTENDREPKRVRREEYPPEKETK